MAVVWFQSLGSELRSHMKLLLAVAKKKTIWVFIFRSLSSQLSVLNTEVTESDLCSKKIRVTTDQCEE